MKPIQCLTCGREFQPTRSGRRYCSMKCSGNRPHHLHGRRLNAPGTPPKHTIMSDEQIFWSNVKTVTAKCWFCHANKNRYGGVRTSKGRMSMHRLSWEIHFGSIPDGLFVLHRCDTPACVNPSHLFLGDHDSNMADRQSKHRQPKGEDQGASLLTASQVLEIRSLYSECPKRGILKALSEQYKVTRQCIWLIVHRKNWKHI
jgi:hypothetical protein